jgi:hypothetical protein
VLLGVAGVAVATLALALLLRVLARREAGPVTIAVSGDVPPAGQWMRKALDSTAASHKGRWLWSDAEDAGMLTGHRGELTSPSAGAELSTTMQPHPHLATIAPSAPLRVAVDLDEFRPRSGAARRLLGTYPDQAARRLRSDLLRAIQREVRAAGATARLPFRIRLRLVGLLCGVALLLALLAITGPPALTGLQRLIQSVQPEPTADPQPSPPASAKPCPPAGRPTAAPARSAVGKSTSCGFAEAVRAAYIKRNPGGKNVTLIKVKNPSTKKVSTVTCTGSGLVTCTGKGVLVYLY